MVMEHRRKAGRKVIVLNPATPAVGFNALDWIGRFGGSKEEDSRRRRRPPFPWLHLQQSGSGRLNRFRRGSPILSPADLDLTVRSFVEGQKLFPR